VSIIAAAVLASRPDSPTRNPPVISFNKAQRPLGSRASSHLSSQVPAPAEPETTPAVNP
jgi:hypothetical protein